MKTGFISSLFALLLISSTIYAQSTDNEKGAKISTKKCGSRKQFFVHTSTGELIETGFYHANQPDLTWIQYNKEGIKLMLAQFQDGLKQGTWYIWDEDGYLKYEIHYVNNTIHSATELDRTGALVASR